MRGILATLGLLLVVLLVTPLWGSWQAARAFASIQSELQAARYGGLEFEAHYERGWLSSQVESRIRSGENTLVLYHQVLHGPIPLVGIGHGVALWPPVRALVISEWWPGSDDPSQGGAWLRAQTRLGLDGSAHVTLESAPREVGDALHWAGMQGEFWASAEGAVSGALAAPELRVGEAGFAIEMRDLRGEIDGQTAAAGVFVGSSVFSVASLSGSGLAGNFSLEGLRWEQRGSEEVAQGSYSVEWIGGFEAFRSDASRYGPAALQLVLRRVDQTALQATLSSANSPAGLDAQALQQLLMRSPEIALEKLEVASPYGQIQASGRIGIDGADPRLAMGWMFAAMALEAGAELRVPSRWLHRVLDRAAADSLASLGYASDAEQLVRGAALRTEWVRELVERGWLVREADHYRLRLEYREGQLLLNGLPTDAESLEALRRMAS